MAATLLRPSMRTLALATTATGLSYTAYHQYNHRSATARNHSNINSTAASASEIFNRTAYAESPASLTSEGSASLTKLPWKGFTELTLESSEQVSPNVKKLTFSLPSSDTITGLSTVTSLLSQHTPSDAILPIPVIRPYTPISTGTTPGKVEFLIKKYPDGKASGKMHSLVPGDKMKFRPIAEYQHETNKHKEMLLIAGGSGITPVYQLVKHILDTPEDNTNITLIYANNSDQDILLRKELEELQTKFDGRFRKVFTVSKNGSNDDTLEQGYVNEALIRKVWSPKSKAGQKILVSGPPAMVESVAGKKGLRGWTQGRLGGVLADLGYTSDDVYKF